MNELPPRGVWLAPWMGPNGEMVLLAVTSRGRLVGDPVTLALGSDQIAQGDALWARLDAEDPEPPALAIQR